MNSSTADLMTKKTASGVKRHSYKEKEAFFDNWSPEARVHWWNRGVPPVYALTANQVSRLNAIRAAHRAKINPVQRKLKNLRMAFHGMDVKTRANLKKLGMNKAKIRLLEDEIVEISRNTEEHIKRLLNPQQAEYLNRNGYGWWNAADACWSTGRDKGIRSRFKMSDRGFSW